MVYNLSVNKKRGENMKNIRRIGFLLVSILLLSNLFIHCYAKVVTVTKENLNTSLQKFVSSSINKDDYKIMVSDQTITIGVDGKNYCFNYNLTGRPTFTLEIPIEKGMSYANFEEQMNGLSLSMIGYMAVANIQGVAFEDINTYFWMSFLENAFNGSWLNENPYIIIDDTNMSNGVTINREENDSNIIYVSEFGERVMEYVNTVYKEKQTLRDSADDINSYEWTIERKDVTDTSCKLVSSFSVNLDADFSKLYDYNSKLAEEALDKNITRENAYYVVDLKVGQKFRIETNERITGYTLSGSGYKYEEINEKCIEITGEKAGKANGYIYVGEEKKSIFITVENMSVSISDLKLEKSIFDFIKDKKHQQIQVIIEPINATNQTLQYQSTNPKIATVSLSGMITPVSKGTCYVDVKTMDGSNLTKRITIHVDLDYTNGDYNEDNELNVTDVYELLTAIAKNKQMESKVKEAVDMDVDGNVDVTDAYLVLKLISEMV